MPFLFSYFHVYADVRLRQVTTSVGHENSLWVLIFKSHVLPQSPKFLGLCRFIFRTQSLLFLKIIHLQYQTENMLYGLYALLQYVHRNFCFSYLVGLHVQMKKTTQKNKCREKNIFRPVSWQFGYFSHDSACTNVFCTRVASNSKKETNLHGILLIGNSNKFTLNTFRPWAGCNQQPIFFYLFLFPF